MGASNTIVVMERAIEAGHSVLIENMGESIDAVLNPIITRSTFKKGRSMFVKMGDKEVEYNKNFKLFLHTKLSNPHYPPEIQAETTLINFTVTEQVRRNSVVRSSVAACIQFLCQSAFQVNTGTLRRVLKTSSWHWL